jgi:hypothetical protein
VKPALCFLANFDFLTADARKLAMTTLTAEILCSEAAIFSAAESQHPEPLLYGITDGKAVGTYLEQKFRLYLKQRYEFIDGNSASGIDFPGILVDVKVRRNTQKPTNARFFDHF